MRFGIFRVFTADILVFEGFTNTRAKDEYWFMEHLELGYTTIQGETKHSGHPFISDKREN